jgi:hypothetical protein
VSGNVTQLHYDLSGLKIRLQPPPDWHATMDRWWGDFAVGRADDPVLDLKVRLTDRAPGPGIALAAELADPDGDGSGARFLMPEGELRLDGRGGGAIDLFDVDDRQRCYAVMNLVLAGLGATLPGRGGAVFHAAGIVVAGRGYLLVGGSGSGKSTWAELALSAGARYLSDDVVFVDGSGERVELLSVPFRADRPKPIGPGRWPLAGILFPRHGNTSRLEPISPLGAQARLTAGLLYVDPTAEAAQRLVTGLSERVPLRTLVFERDPAFLELLAELGEAES